MRFPTTTTTSLLLLATLVLASASDPTHEEDTSTHNRDVTTNLPPYPSVRFTAWDALPHTVRDHARAAGYKEKPWNKPGTSAVEKLDYESLEDPLQHFLKSVDITAAQWDCYINHYRNYDWEELEEGKKHYTTLGWTHELWSQDGATPELEGKYWEDLSPEQQAAAQAVCYTPELWDEVAIPLWQQDDGSGGEAGHKDDKDLYSVKETEVADAKQDVYENLYDANDRSDQPYKGPLNAHNDRNIDVPFFRYQPWDLLDEKFQELAVAADYDEKSWNAIGSHPLERKDFETIAKEEHHAFGALKKMGFTEDTWDCYMSHYISYEWGELADAGVQSYYQELGYDHKSWEQDTKPDTDGVYWPDLTSTQQNAAYQVGYFREVWDEVSLQFWPRTTSNTASLKDYAKKHPAAAGGGAFIAITVLIGCIFCCGCFFRRSSKKEWNPYPEDLEMYGMDGRYKDDDDDDKEEEEGYNDGYEGEEKTDKEIV